MNFKGKAKRLDDIDLPFAGALIGVGEDEVHAVLDVESAGTGFDAQGRPRMLFEPHIFYKQLGPGPVRDRAVKAGLAYAKWKPGAYPKDSYPRLAEAMKIDSNAALRSASWGLGQIMGFNHQMAGHPSAKAMVEAFLDDEKMHLIAMVNFIRAAGLDTALRNHDWRGFARGYNGSGFERNGYDKKLAASFAKWKRIKDTPADTGPPVRPDVEPLAPKPVAASEGAKVKRQAAPVGRIVAAVLAIIAAAAAYLGWK